MIRRWIHGFLLVACLCGLGSAKAQVPLSTLANLPGPELEIVRGQDPAIEPVEEAEDDDEIETDRDSFTPASTTAGWGRLIVESAYSFVDNRNAYETHSLPELVLRYGLTDWLEIRLGWNYEIGGEAASISGGDLGEEFFSSRLVEEHQASYGIKIGLTEQNGWKPTSALIVQGFTPTGGPNPDSSVIATYVCGWTLGNGWKLDSAMRYGTESEQEDHGNLWAPSVVLKKQLGERWNTHLEYFGIFSDGLEKDRTAQYLSPGLHYLIHANYEVGLRIGWGLNDDAANFFSNIGIGYRF